LLEQILSALKIEIPQLITHIIGFLLALWVLKKFAWKPILAVLDERRDKIKSSFDDIEAKKAAAEKLHQDYEAKLRTIDEEARQRLNAAVQEGEKIAGQIKDNARNEAKEMMERSKSELEQDFAKARIQLKEEIVNLTIGAAERIIHERLDQPKHRDLINRFIDDVEKVK
jgi:F-type H+-transporting ATPase subunit b